MTHGHGYFLRETPDTVSGALQINARVASGLLSGNLPLFVSFGGTNSQIGVAAAVR
jgi:hypothetical protein